MIEQEPGPLHPSYLELDQLFLAARGVGGGLRARGRRREHSGPHGARRTARGKRSGSRGAS